MPPLKLDDQKQPGDENQQTDELQQLAGKRGAGYWRALSQISAELVARDENILCSDGDAQTISRRSLLKLLGASMALAGLPACTREPRELLVPYVKQPEMLVPGRARYYATAALVGGYAQGVLAESHEGRPIKLEGNPDHPATLGACDAISQASVLSLYDPDRSASVRNRGGIASYREFLRELENKRRQWNANRGRGLAFVSGAITSPSARARIDALRERWPEARWFVHEPVDRDGVFAGSKILFGRPLEPRYRFDRVDVALALDADFMQAQPGFLRYAREFSARRRPRDGSENFARRSLNLARLYAIESTPSVTGANADQRFALLYPQIEDAARALARALGIAVTPPRHNPLPARWLNALVADLQRNPGAALLVPGDQQSPAVHALAHAINRKLNAFGNTLEWIQPVAFDPRAQPLEFLTAAINAGEIESLVILDSNPLYSAPANLNFTEAFNKVPWRLHWGEYVDETARLSHWHIPAAHPLESWGDARAFDGSAALLQPLIQPLHGGKSTLQFLHALEQGTDEDARKLLSNYWQQQYQGEDFELFWRTSLRDGVVADSAAAAVNAELAGDWIAKLPVPKPAQNGLTLQFRPDPALWDGRYANNGWLQELPRPLTTLTWDNALLISPELAARENLRDGNLVKLTSQGRSLTLPVLTMPGQPKYALTLYLGYGRGNAGRVGDGVGVSAYKLRVSDSPWALSATIQPTGAEQTLALTQKHHSIEGRDLVRTADLAEYRRNPQFAQKHALQLSIYPEPEPKADEDRHAWAMAIDLSACIGCNACVTACQAENNIPIVGASEVARGHDMHWLRVDRYFSDSALDSVEQPRITFQPVPCMQCENAPCEYVCPVGATLHSSDGLNQMIYQRCVGTRYCSQNCPYKVRRFNWFDYTGTSAAYPALPPLQNPNVTVRARGVMEKCTYCVQRIVAVRRQAETEQRPIAEGELQTACQQSCPTQAIVFGDLAQTDGQLNRLRASPLNYAMLEDRNTRPRTTYLAAVHNPNPELKDDDSS